MWFAWYAVRVTLIRIYVRHCTCVFIIWYVARATRNLNANVLARTRASRRIFIHIYSLIYKSSYANYAILANQFFLGKFYQDYDSPSFLNSLTYFGSMNIFKCLIMISLWNKCFCWTNYRYLTYIVWMYVWVCPLDSEDVCMSGEVTTIIHYVCCNYGHTRVISLSWSMHECITLHQVGICTSLCVTNLTHTIS